MLFLWMSLPPLTRSQILPGSYLYLNYVNNVLSTLGPEDCSLLHSGGLYFPHLNTQLPLPAILNYPI